MNNHRDAILKLYSEKENLIIIGLTGRTGAGCSTAANILKKRYEELELEYIENEEKLINSPYEFEIIKNYIRDNGRWVPFEVIEGSCVILSYIFESKDESESVSGRFIDYLRELQSDENTDLFKIDNFTGLIKEIEGLNYIFELIQQKPLKLVKDWKNFSNEEINIYYDLYIKNIPEYKNRIKKILLKYSCYEKKKKKIQDEPTVKYHLYTYILQKIANNIRASGDPYNSELLQNEILEFAKRIQLMIELIRIHNKINSIAKTRICIDAIRNSNESNYIKDIYRPYYLISISVDEKMRQKRLGGLDSDEQRSLDNVEYSSRLKPDEIFYHQNIANCFEMADIHLVNKDEKNDRRLKITWQLVKYITLMLHPGLIIPSKIESCMQLAYNAKYNSGCISRQVGAVVTGPDYAIKSVGWNEAPSKQLSCIYRNVNGYCKGNNKQCYSEFEYEDSNFKKAIQYINNKLEKCNLNGQNFSYCFKDIYNGINGSKNQVYTRALHAEENAFLQISKYGGQGIKGGFLFCTASPCELCSKKAFQLGIKNIYYIDPYPGIAQKHILCFGNGEYNPQIKLFSGAIGEAYVRLYRPMMSIKDELELISGIDFTEQAQNAILCNENEPNVKDFNYELMEVSLEFINRENIESIRKVDIQVENGEYSYLDRKITWTGSSYDKSELLNCDEYGLIDSTNQASPYKYKILLNKTVKKGDKINYEIKTYLKDESHLMHEYFAQVIRNPIKKLILNVIIPKEKPLLENVRYVRYADMDMEYEFPDNENNYQEIDCDNKTIYKLTIENPNLFYTYSIEWDFIKVKS